MLCTNSEDFFPLSVPSAAECWQQVKNKPRQSSERWYNVTHLPDLWLLEVVCLSTEPAAQFSFLTHSHPYTCSFRFKAKELTPVCWLNSKANNCVLPT